MDDDIEDYIDCLEGGLRDEVKNIVFALNNDRNQDRDSLNQFFKKSLWKGTFKVTSMLVTDVGD